MVKAIAQLVLSFMVTSWIYAEIVLLYPPLKILGDRFVQVFQIPTHNEWGDIARSPRAKKLGVDLNSSLSRLTGGRFDLLESSVAKFWQAHPYFGSEERVTKVAHFSGWSPFNDEGTETLSGDLKGLSGDMTHF